jgi:hypothetical protein
MKRLVAALGSFLMIAIAAVGARAADLDPRGHSSAGATSLRVYGGLEVYLAAELGLDVSRQLTPWLALDGMVAAVDLGRDEGAKGHLRPRLTVGDRHRLSVALGPSLLIADSYGTVAFLGLEVGYEFRAARGLSFIIAAGPSMALNDSGLGSCNYDKSGWFSGCWLERESYRAGDLMGGLRLGIGASF